jgi:hypothetical protein
LAACATGPSRTVSTCPPIRAYDGAFLDRLAAETETLPAGSAIEEALIDYQDLRNQLRPCQ